MFVRFIIELKPGDSEIAGKWQVSFVWKRNVNKKGDFYRRCRVIAVRRIFDSHWIGNKQKSLSNIRIRKEEKECKKQNIIWVSLFKYFASPWWNKYLFKIKRFSNALAYRAHGKSFRKKNFLQKSAFLAINKGFREYSIRHSLFSVPLGKRAMGKRERERERERESDN